jgi:hypothetical protein
MVEWIVEDVLDKSGTAGQAEILGFEFQSGNVDVREELLSRALPL